MHGIPRCPGLAKQNLLVELSTVLVELRGSLALTGIGHNTNKAPLKSADFSDFHFDAEAVLRFVKLVC